MKHADRSNLIIHIPHSSTAIPDKSAFNDEVLESELDLMTDHFTDEIFDIPGAERIIFPDSRLFCDVERFPNDEDEPMAKFGRGLFYTHTDNGCELRKYTPEQRIEVLDNYYRPHHAKLNDAVNKRLKQGKQAIIIDAHSFPDTPLQTDLIKEPNRTDICIGTDKSHTPEEFRSAAIAACDKFNFTYLLNNPYEGTIVPLEHYGKEKEVKSIMIEINRKLYLPGNTVKRDKDKIEKLRGFVEFFVCLLLEEE